MTITGFGFIFSLRRGFSKNPLPTQKGSVYPTFQLAQYWAGYEAGIHKSRALVAKALEHEIAADKDRDHWKSKYRSELPQYKDLLARLRTHVSDDVWREVTQGQSPRLASESSLEQNPPNSAEGEENA